jgi:XRE family transcriptional regulator, regulator of sulfur utilization
MRYIAQEEIAKMDNLNLIVADNLKRIRKEKKLSLDSVAALAGVSKSMLGQIERGESSPTINMLWKIASGLRLSFSELITPNFKSDVFISGRNVTPILSDNGRYRLYPFFPYEENRNFEMYSVEMDENAYLKAESHGENIEEFITVFEGKVTIIVDEKEYLVDKGSSIRFKADRPHEYLNQHKTTVKISLVLYYSK